MEQVKCATYCTRSNHRILILGHIQDVYRWISQKKIFGSPGAPVTEILTPKILKMLVIRPKKINVPGLILLKYGMHVILKWPQFCIFQIKFSHMSIKSYRGRTDQWLSKNSEKNFTDLYDLRTTLLLTCTKILFKKCKIGVILRSHASHILIRSVREHWFFWAWLRAFSGFWGSISRWPVRPGTRKFFFEIFTHRCLKYVLGSKFDDLSGCKKWHI